jgi:ribosomal protein S3AE
VSGEQRLGTIREKINAKIDANQEKITALQKACLEKMDTTIRPKLKTKLCGFSPQ